MSRVRSASASLPEPLPAWLSERVADFERRLKLVIPYPFSHPADQGAMVQLHQNDYLRLSGRPEVRFARTEAIRRCTGGEFLGSNVFGNGEEDAPHLAFRNRLAAGMQAEEVVLATSGWAANVGLLHSLSQAGKPVYLDAKAHASLWDGARLAGARTIMVRHNDPQALRRRIRRDGAGIVCIDAFYSNSGAVCDLRSYVEVCEESGSILVLDEAHSLGMVGADQGGLAVASGLAGRVPFRTASLAKALGGHGGIVATSRRMADFLCHQSHAMVFSTHPSPSDSAGHLEAYRLSCEEPWLAANTLDRCAQFRQILTDAGVDCGPSACQIVSLSLDSEPATAALYGALRERGVLAAVFMYPAMTYGRGLLRFTFHALLTREDVDRAAAAVLESLDRLSIRRDRVGAG